ncbi:DUF1365 domain-containing protein [Photobacterium sp. 1_MG-2023]|uniref:DUF1365 domain-containing protein n=1 Tax=Photobacterium sp. 1_MG-2023 TaxID=3062646 RepID=UPI0026E3E65B|nr:DUF1365 domain-containing protein [Photobacterium sp. 1_MG-2023]MDO6706970.1 DUF1365 domain-containing protein [Photobacterium sp. 1_MG-2023]
MSAAGLQSGLYVGQVRHRRYSPAQHAFTYPMFMPLIDLDELDALAEMVRGFGCRWYHPARWRRQDYLRNEGDGPLKTRVQEKIMALTGERLTGKVMQLCQLRYFGVYFSPINLYYCFNEQGEWRWLLAEVSNTPWNQRHYYAVPAVSDWHEKQWIQGKAFHVSPFNPMAQHYLWRLRPPEKQVFVHLDIAGKAAQDTVMDATMALRRRTFSTSVLWQLLRQTPVQTVKVLWGIYVQAWKLWRKKVPFYGHPGSGHLPVHKDREQTNQPER